MHNSLNDPLLQPLTLKHLKLRNRVVSASHEPAYTEGGMPKDQYRLYHAEKAKGGIGMTMIGGSAVVSRDSPPIFGNLALYKDEVVPWLRCLTDDVHEYGAAVMCQITHLGRRTVSNTYDGLPVISASSAREPAHRAFPKVAEAWDLRRIAQDYASAAARCKESGIDGIEIESYGHFFDSFLSPRTNNRLDQWGGSIKNRIRFPLEVIRSVRNAVGPDYIVGIRMMMDEGLPNGLSYNDAIEALSAYINEGIDFVSVIKGNIESDASLAKVIPSMGTPSAPYLDLAGQVKRDVSIPTMHSARIQDIATARYAIREGLVDLVGMTRPHIADPHIVAKIKAGNENRIRPCVGANFCLDSNGSPGGTKCIHNPSTGRETTLPHEISLTRGSLKKAVIVGAGPAGLEAARVLGARGHHVVLMEANNILGGQIPIAAASPRRKDLAGITDWRIEELQHVNVEIRSSVYAEREEVLAEQPDIVITATGGLPNMSMSNIGEELVNSTWDVLTDPYSFSGNVLIYDDHGGYPAMDAAEVLASNGVSVYIVTPERSLAIDVGGTNLSAYMAVFAKNDVSTTLGWRLWSVGRSDRKLRAAFYSEHAEGIKRERLFDHIVIEHGTLPNDELYFDLLPNSSNYGEIDQSALLSLQPQNINHNDAGRFQLFRIGDAVASRNIHAAILDAARLCSPM